jgi:hypothetical protein
MGSKRKQEEWRSGKTKRWRGEVGVLVITTLVAFFALSAHSMVKPNLHLLDPSPFLPWS